jgi:hypothetical protein
MFQPGQSGNPSGRPKVDPKLRDAARAKTDEALAVLIDCLSDPDKRIALKAAELLLDRGWGKAAQTLAGEDGEGPAELVVRWATQSKS